MHIAPKPGLPYPAFALKKLHHRKGLSFSVVLLFLGIMGFSASSLAFKVVKYDHTGKLDKVKEYRNAGEYNTATAFAETPSLLPGVPDVNHPGTKLTVIIDNSFAGQGLNKIKAHIVDAEGNPVVGVDVSFTWNPGTGDVSVGATTDALGDAYLSTGFITPGTLAINGKVRIGASWVPLENDNPIVVTFIEYVPDVNVSETELIIVSNNANANGLSTNCVKAHMAGANGLPVAGQAVTFHVSGTATPDGPLTANTDVNGDATICLKSTLAGDVSVTAEVNGTSVINGSPAIVTFIADVPSVSNTSTALSDVSDNAKADGVATNCVRAHVEDANGNDVPNQPVVFAVPAGTATPSGGTYTVTTDINGNAEICFTSTIAGEVPVTATVNGAAIITGSPLTVTFIADVPSVGNASTALSDVSDNAKADGVATNCVRAHIADANGNAVPNQPVIFAVPAGTATPSGGTYTVTTDINGNAGICFTSTIAGEVPVTATVNGAAIITGSPLTVTFIADVPSVGNASTALSGVSDNAKADGVATNCVRAHVEDANGNAVPNQPVIFAVPAGTATPSGGTYTVTTDINGNAGICFTSTVAGEVPVTATVNGAAIITGSPLTVTFIADVPSVGNTSTALSGVSDNAKADGVATNCVRAHITDANGNAVPNQPVIFAVPAGTATPSGGTYTVTTDINGNAGICFTSVIAGEVPVTATVNGTAIITGSPLTVTFIADVPSVGNASTALSDVSDNAKADGVATNCVRAHITDANGNAVPNQPVIFAVPAGTATPSGGTYTVTTDINGDAGICFTSTVAGEVPVTATVNGAAIITGSPLTVTFIADVPSVSNASTALSDVSDNAKADGVATNCVRAHITDANGNAVPNQPVIFAVPAGTATPSGGTYTVTTDINGDAKICFTSMIAGEVPVTATVNGAAIITGSPLTVTFIADVPSVGNASTALSDVSDNAKADGVATNCVRAHITDANGNAVPNQPVIFAVPAGTATPSGGTYTVTTDINGNAEICFTSTIVGEVPVTATVNGAAIITGSPLTVTFIAYIPSVGNTSTALSGVSDNAKADGVATNCVRAHITDANGNAVPNQPVIFAVPAGTATPSGGTYTVTTDINGNAEICFTSTVAGEVTITAIVNGAAIITGSPQTVTFIADAPNTGVPDTYLLEIKTVANADGVDENSVLAHITDANGNIVANQDVVFSLTGSTTGTMTVKTDADGNAVLTIKSTAAGWVTITATVDGTPITNGSPCKVKFVEGVPDTGSSDTRLEVVTNNAPANDVSTNSVKAHITDAYGNPVPGQAVTFTIASGTASPGTYTATTDANGDALFEFHSDRGGEVTVTARLNPADPATAIIQGSPATVKFIADPDISNPATILTVVTDNALADGIASNSVKAHITDAYGNALENIEVVFTTISGDAVITGSGPFKTDANGDIIISLTSKKQGFVTIAAKVDGNTVSGSPAKLRFTIEDIWVPKVFTPNGDGTNDVLKPIITGTFDFSYFSIYNRWGNLVFTSTNVNIGWDGRLKGVMQPIETYLWVIGGKDKDGNPAQRKGMVSVVR